MGISTRIKNRINELNLSEAELARRSGVPQPTIHRIISGDIKSPRIESIEPIAKTLMLSLDFLATGKENKNFSTLDYIEAEKEAKLKNETVIEIPQFDIEAAMGDGKFPPDYQQPVLTITVDKDFFTRQGINVTSGSKLTIITGMGDSMAGTFNSGDPVVLDNGIQSLNEDGIYVFTLGDRLYLKRLQLLPNCIRMISDNAKYPPYDIRDDELQQLIIHGKVLFAWNGKRV